MGDERLEILASLRQKMTAFEIDSHEIFRRFETSHIVRITDVAESRRMLGNLSLRQEQLFDEALGCVSYGLYRAAHVSAWQAFMDCIDNALDSAGLYNLSEHFPKWSTDGGLELLQDETNEHQRIIAAHKLGLLTKAGMKSAHGHLSTRNDCAHPSQYEPGFNQALGYVSDLITRAGRLTLYRKVT